MKDYVIFFDVGWDLVSENINGNVNIWDVD